MACEHSVVLSHNNKGDDDDGYKGVSRKKQGRASEIRQKHRKGGSFFKATRSLSFLLFSKCLIPSSVLCRLGHRLQTEAEVPSAFKLGGSMLVFTLQISGRAKQRSPAGVRQPPGVLSLVVCVGAYGANGFLGLPLPD